MNLRFLLLCALFVFLAPAAPAQENALFCPALRSAEAYDKSLASYKFMIEGTDGWIFRSESDFRQHFDLNAGIVRLMRQLQDSLAAQGVTLVVFYAPTRGMVAHEHIKPADAAAFGFSSPDIAWQEYKNTIEKMRQGGVHFIGVPRVKAESADFFYKRDHHWNANGAKISADEIAAYVRSLPVYAGLEKTAFQTSSKGPAIYKGTWGKVFRQLCKTDLPPIQITDFQTMRSGQPATAEALFGSAAEPQVVLLGTSNSTRQGPAFANFEGFLKQGLSADILNLAVAGAGIETSFFNWLASEHRKTGAAKILIWEIPGYYEFNKEGRLFRQLIPAAYGDCGDKAVASAADVAFSGREVELFKGLEATKISGDGYYIYLRFSAPLKKNFSINADFTDGSDKTLISRREKAKAEDTYFFLLKTWKKGVLRGVSLESDVVMDGVSVNAEICKLP